MPAAMRHFGPPPTADEIEAIARDALLALPRPFADSIGDIVLQVEEFADDRTLDSLGIEDPFDLTGLYEGVPLTERSIDQSGVLPERVRLFRRPLLDEWATRDETLERLIAHVLIHEIGHHFGLSDADMHALEGKVA
jgi:predicted Zn-dependent protease with MMP-like domain